MNSLGQVGSRDSPLCGVPCPDHGLLCTRGGVGAADLLWWYAWMRCWQGSCLHNLSLPIGQFYLTFCNLFSMWAWGGYYEHGYGSSWRLVPAALLLAAWSVETQSRRALCILGLTPSVMPKDFLYPYIRSSSVYPYFMRAGPVAWAGLTSAPVAVPPFVMAVPSRAEDLRDRLPST